MRHALSLALQILVDAGVIAVDRHGWEAVDEAAQRLIDLLLADLVVEPVEGVRHHSGVLVLAVPLDHVMEDFVDEAHGVDLAGLHRTFWIADQVAALVHLLSEKPSCVEIDKDNVAGEGEEGLVQGIEFTSLTRDVELLRSALCISNLGQSDDHGSLHSPALSRGESSPRTPACCPFRNSRTATPGCLRVLWTAKRHAQISRETTKMLSRADTLQAFHPSQANAYGRYGASGRPVGPMCVTLDANARTLASAPPSVGLSGGLHGSLQFTEVDCHLYLPWTLRLQKD